MKLNSRSILILVSFIIFFQIHQGVFSQNKNIDQPTRFKMAEPFGPIKTISDSKYKEKLERFNAPSKGHSLDSTRRVFGSTPFIIDTGQVQQRALETSERLRSETDWVLNREQPVAFPSPNSSALIKETKLAVDNYTGALNYQIPLYELKSHDITLPIYLSYTSNGIKVDEIASWVGLGWNLHAGGCITRVVNGLADEFSGNIITIYGISLPAYGYLNLPANVDLSNFDNLTVDDQKKLVRNANWQNLSGYSEDGMDQGEAWDTHPDEFYFNFPGYSGKFVFTQEGEIISIPHQNLSIVEYKQVVGQKNKIVRFDVITPEGYKYIFGDSGENIDTNYIENTAHVNVSRMVRYWYPYLGCDSYFMFDLYGRYPLLIPVTDTSCVSLDTESIKFFSSSTWHLNKIISPNDDYINFYYRSQLHWDFYVGDRNENVTLPKLDEAYYRYPNSNDSVAVFFSYIDDHLGDWHSQEVTFSRDELVVTTKLLSSIVTKSGGKLEFITSSELREDLLDAEKLNSVKVFNDLGELIKSYKFDQYYTKPDEFEPKNDFYLGELPSGKVLAYDEYKKSTNDILRFSEQKRMLLNKLTEYDKNMINKLPSYIFEYNSTPLPRRASYRTDIYGFYNHNNRGTKIPKISYTGFVSDSTIPLPLAPEFNLLFTWFNTGAEEISYKGAKQSANEEKAKASSLIKVITPTGGAYEFEYELNKIGTKPGYGLRVKTIKAYPDFRNSFDFIESDYTYYFGAMNTSSKFYYELPVNSKEGKLLSYFSNPIRYLYTTKGSPVGYGKVQVSKSGSGSSFYYYKNPDTIHNQSPDNYEAGQSPPQVADYPFAREMDMDWQRGLESIVTVTKSSGSEVTEKTNSKYVFNPAIYTSQYSFGLTPGVFKKDSPIEGNVFPHYYAGIYKYQSGWYYKDKTTNTVFSSTDPGDESKAVVNQVDYDYKVITHDDLQYTFLDSQTELNSKSQPQEITYTYPLDISDPSDVLTTQPVIDELISKHMLSTILKTEKSNNYKKVEGQINTYRVELNEEDSTMVLPAITNLLEGETYKPKAYYDKYDDKGNIIEYHEKDNYSTTFLWGYHYQYPIAKIENAEYSYVLGQLNNIPYTDLQSKTSGQLVNIFNALRQKPEMADKTVYSYTYDPLIGMTSETDPNGNTLKYIYDDFNRLETITDKEDMVLKHVDYHYFEAILEANPASFIIENDGGTFSVAITSNLHWAVSENSNWLSIIPPTEGTNDGSFQFVCSKNTVPNARSSEITVSGSGISKTISITQLEGDYITVSPSQLCEMIASGADGCEFTINSNIEWTATINDGSDFFSFYPPSGSGQGITFNIDSNGPVQSPQTGSVVISGNGISKVITVTQGHP